MKSDYLRHLYRRAGFGMNNTEFKSLKKKCTKDIYSFIHDLRRGGTLKDTLILTFSEFGRRPQQNAGNGTDHGTANNLFVFGDNLKKQGVYNNLVSLTDLDNNGDLKFEIDFREIYATVLNKWLNVNSKDILNYSKSSLDFI